MADWYIHLTGETIGPIPTETVKLLLDQYRVRLVDFAWCEGMSEWKRLTEIDEFSGLLPSYPDAPTPDPGARAGLPPVGPTAQTGAPPRGRLRVRRFERVPLKGTVSIGGLGDFEATDISESGVGIKGYVSLFIGTPVTLRLQSEELKEPLSMTGQIVQHPASDSYGFGIEFTNIEPRHRQLIKDFVASKKA